MGSWLAKLAGQEDNAAKILKNPHSIAAYTLVFGLAFLVLLLWFVIIIVTAIRIFKKYSRKEAPLKVSKKFNKSHIFNYVWPRKS